jgi:4-amino-4-deoxy-L-arabinose transferase-like glycosyltransferase
MGPNAQKTVRWVLLTLLLSLVGAIVVLSCVPPVSRDELTHHLAVPKLYLAHGGIFEIPWIVFSYYPMNLDLLYMLPLYLGSDIAPKFVHFSFALLTAGLLFRYLKEKIDVRYGLLGALVFLSIPVIVKLSVTAYVDLGLIFFSTASLLGLLRWAEKDFAWRYLNLAAVSCGLALGTKYNGLVVLFCVTLMVPLLYIRGGVPNGARQFRAIGMGAVFVAVAALVFSPWMIRDYIWTGNPVYPLYDHVFNPVQPPVAALAPVNEGAAPTESETAGPQPQANLSHFRFRSLVYGESGLEILTTPLRIFFLGRDDDPKYWDGKLNPLLLVLLLVAVAGWRRGVARERMLNEKALFGFSVLYLLTAYLQTDMRIRWIAPIIPPLVILSMFGLRRLELYAAGAHGPFLKGLRASVVIGAILLLLGLNMAYVAGLFGTIRPLDYISGKETRAEYITRYRREYPVVEYANQHLPRDARILAFYLGNRTYYSERYLDCRYAVFFEALKGAQSAEGLLQALRTDGYSHLLIREDMFRESLDSSMSQADQRKVLAFFEEHVRQLVSANGYALFALRD